MAAVSEFQQPVDAADGIIPSGRNVMNLRKLNALIYDS
jgi:hypothetical protein